MPLACHVIAVTVLQIWSLNALSLGVIEWALGPALIKPSLALNPLSFRIFALKNKKIVTGTEPSPPNGCRKSACKHRLIGQPVSKFTLWGENKNEQVKIIQNFH